MASTRDRLLAALRIPRRGEVVELALPLDGDAGPATGRRWDLSILTDGASEEYRRSTPNRDTYLDEAVSGSLHAGCHVDALGHGGIDGRFHGGLSLEQVVGPSGLRLLGIERSGPWFGRGVCLDLARLNDVERLDAGFAISAEQLEAAARRQRLEVEPGDVVLLHTGWARLHRTDLGRYFEAEPGADEGAARWLTERDVALVGADNWGFEAVPSGPEPRARFPAHQHLLAEAGTNILENVDTAPLVARGGDEFLFVAAPAKMVGATAGPVSPLAVI